jgi:integrase
MCDFFLEHKRKKVERSGKKGGYPAAKSLCGHIKRSEISKKTFRDCCEDTSILEDHIDNLKKRHPNWSDKTIWNYFKELKAVFSRWILKNLIQLPNPMNSLDCPDPNIRVMNYVPTQADFEKIQVIGITEGVRLDALRLLTVVRYTGLRVQEVLNFQIPDCVLDPGDGGLPYVWADVLKQGRHVRVALPLHAKAMAALREQIAERKGGQVWPWINPPYDLFKVKSPDDEDKLISIEELAGVPIRPFHDWRKTVKLEVKRKIKDPKMAKAFQGHRTDSADDYYTFYQREDLESIVADSYSVTNGVTKKEKGESFDSP